MLSLCISFYISIVSDSLLKKAGSQSFHELCFLAPMPKFSFNHDLASTAAATTTTSPATAKGNGTLGPVVQSFAVLLKKRICVCSCWNPLNPSKSCKIQLCHRRPDLARSQSILKVKAMPLSLRYSHIKHGKRLMPGPRALKTAFRACHLCPADPAGSIRKMRWLMATGRIEWRRW